MGGAGSPAAEIPSMTAVAAESGRLACVPVPRAIAMQTAQALNPPSCLGPGVWALVGLVREPAGHPQLAYVTEDRVVFCGDHVVPVRVDEVAVLLIAKPAGGVVADCLQRQIPF